MFILFFYMRLFNKDRGYHIDCYVPPVVKIISSVGEMCGDWLISQPAVSNWGSSIKSYCGKISAACIAVHKSNLIMMRTSESKPASTCRLAFAKPN